jgi:hypothetical protein
MTKRLPGKHARALAKAIIKAGGQYTLTPNGHFRVTGPEGVAFVSTRSNCMAGVGAVNDIRRHTGLEVVL